MGAYRYLLESSPGFTLGAALEFTESDFAEDFLDVWALEGKSPPADMDQDEWLECRRIYGIASQIAEAALLLVRKKGLGAQRMAFGTQLAEDARAYDKHLDELISAIRPQLSPEDYSQVASQLDTLSPNDPRSRRAIFENTLQLAVRHIFPPTLDETAARLESLVRYVVASQNERTNAFLARVATCYCLNLKTELAVMSRAVLDTALQEAVADEAVRKALNLARRDRVGLSARLQYLANFELIAAEARESMNRLKRAGDDAVHTAPGLEPDPDVLMGDLLSALTALDRLRG